MEATDLRAAGDRIEALLAEIRSADRRVRDQAEELVRLVTELYGTALTHVIETASRGGGAGRANLLDRLAEDELVASLLLVHGLHPTSMSERVDRALDHVRNSRGAEAADVRLLDVDEAHGRARVRILGDGGPFSMAELERAVQQAITDFAPDIVEIDLELPPPPEPVSTPVRLTRRNPTMAAADVPR